MTTHRLRVNEAQVFQQFLIRLKMYEVSKSTLRRVWVPLVFLCFQIHPIKKQRYVYHGTDYFFSFCYIYEFTTLCLRCLNLYKSTKNNLQKKVKSR